MFAEVLQVVFIQVAWEPLAFTLSSLELKGRASFERRCDAFSGFGSHCLRPLQPFLELLEDQFVV